MGSGSNVYECANVSTYSIGLAADTYTVYVYSDMRKTVTGTLTVSAATTYNVTIHNAIARVIELDSGPSNTTAAMTYTADGRSAIYEDYKVGSTVWLNAGKVDNIVIDFTVENFVDETTFNSGKYEKDITLHVKIHDGTDLAYYGFAGGRLRYYHPDVGQQITDRDERVLQTKAGGEYYGVCAMGGRYKIRFIKNNDIIYLYAYSLNSQTVTDYVLLQEVDLLSVGPSISGDCYYGFGFGTSFVYNKIRIVNTEYVTDDTQVANILASM